MVAPAKSGPEILVNTTTTSDQEHPSVTALKNGKFVVVWHDFNQPGSGADTSFDAVRGQMFNADGSKMGAEFVLSGAAQTLGVQQDPTVITLNDGRFVAEWESFNHQSGDPSGSCIDARIYNSDRTPATNEFLVNTHTDFWQTRASMAPLDTGGFIVTWMHNFQVGNQNYDIFARLYGANGNPGEQYRFRRSGRRRDRGWPGGDRTARQQIHDRVEGRRRAYPQRRVGLPRRRHRADRQQSRDAGRAAVHRQFDDHQRPVATRHRAARQRQCRHHVYARLQRD